MRLRNRQRRLPIRQRQTLEASQASRYGGGALGTAFAYVGRAYPNRIRRTVMNRFLAAALACSTCTCLLAVAGLPAGDTKKPGPDAATWNKVVDKAVDYLKGTQQPSGGWSTDKTPGVTGVVLTGLLRSGRVTPNDPGAERALKYIESLVDPKHKHIAGKGAKVQLQNYVTSINVMALVQANRSDKYRAIIGDAVEFLKKLQWDESEGKTPQDPYFGGAGYDSKSRPDLSNTQTFLDALKAAGVAADDPALKKALVFVSRCQNIKGESNDRPWAKLLDDGSFIYTPATGGVTKVVDQPL